LIYLSRAGVGVDLSLLEWVAARTKTARDESTECKPMARLGRYFIPGQPLHVIQRGNDRRSIFFAPDDYARYREWLHVASVANGCAIHAYVLMSNHVHMLVTPSNEDSLPKTMQSLGRRYVRHINWAYGRSGTMWEGRYRAAMIDPDTCLLACMRYIELNPVRAKLVKEPREYQWSSYRANVFGEYDALVREHERYRDLGVDAAQRRAAYQTLFDEPMDEEFIATLRAATNGGWPFGGDEFKQLIAQSLGRRVAPLPRGRPPKSIAI
jgi:putative transposase